MQAYSVPERLTPRKWTLRPFASRSLFPTTWSPFWAEEAPTALPAAGVATQVAASARPASRRKTPLRTSLRIDANDGRRHPVRRPGRDPGPGRALSARPGGCGALLPEAGAAGDRRHARGRPDPGARRRGLDRAVRPGVRGADVSGRAVRGGRRRGQLHGRHRAPGEGC